MKYHYQHVSKLTVRIELVPEHRHEIEFLEKAKVFAHTDQEVLEIFRNGLKTYSVGAKLEATKFMNFPKVALCSLSNIEKIVEVLVCEEVKVMPQVSGQ